MLLEMGSATAPGGGGGSEAGAGMMAGTGAASTACHPQLHDVDEAKTLLVDEPQRPDNTPFMSAARTWAGSIKC